MGCSSHTKFSKDHLDLSKIHTCNFKSYEDTSDYTIISANNTCSYKSTDSDEEFIEFSGYLMHDKIYPI